MDFKLLTENVVDEDAFEGQPHDKIAQTLYKIIDEQEEAVTIGLEGEWGSGKSTVISILEKKIRKKEEKEVDEKKGRIKVVKFDSWAHEGNNLRRIFLENLIIELESKESENSDWGTKRLKKLRNPKQKNTVKTKQKAKSLGRWVTLSALFIPLGIGLISNVDNLIINIRSDFNKQFLTGLFFCLSPLFVLIVNSVIQYFKINRPVYSPKNFKFLQTDIKQLSNQSVALNNERSSVEFAKNFDEIITQYVCVKDKLVIVIDNLDRIEPEETKRVLSTLQTYFQKRNTLGDIEKKVWFVFVYNPSSLNSKFIKNKCKSASENKTETSSENNEVNERFLDKTIQLKIDVPRPIFTTWEKYLKDQTDYAFEDSTKEASDINNLKDLMIKIIRITRNDLSDIPTPRLIKNYINQTLLINYAKDSNSIDLLSITYYAYLKVFLNKTLDELIKELKSGVIPSYSLALHLPSSIKKDLASIIFSVNPVDAYQLLLENEISESLRSKNQKEIETLIRTHKYDFWKVFDYHIVQSSSRLGTTGFYNYAFTLSQGDMLNNIEHYKTFIDKSEKYVLRDIEKDPFPHHDNYEGILALLDLWKDNPDSIDKVSESIFKEFEKLFSNNDKPNEKQIEFVINLLKVTPKYDNLENKIISSRLNLESLNVLYSYSQNVHTDKAWDWILADRTKTDASIEERFNNSNIKEDLINSIIYQSNAQEVDDNLIIIRTREYIDAIRELKLADTIMDNKNQTENIEFDLIVKLYVFYSLKSIESDSLRDVLYGNDNPFLLLTMQSISINRIPVAIILACLYNQESDEYNKFQDSSNIIVGYPSVFRLWKSSSIPDALAVIEYLKQHDEYEFLWALLSDTRNLLVFRIINITSAKLDYFNFFKHENYMRSIEIIKEHKSYSKREIERIVKLTRMENEEQS